VPFAGLTQNLMSDSTQYSYWDRWRLLSAAQALTICELVRLTHGKNHVAFPDMDVALLFTLRKIFKLLEAQGDLDYRRRTPISDWKDWIFHESAMRTTMIYFILTLVLCMDDGIRCNQPDDWLLEDLPLPGLKVMWQAPDEVAWRQACSSCRYEALADLTFGDLMNEQLPPQRIEAVERWQEGVDDFGLIVAIASRLPRPVHLLR